MDELTKSISQITKQILLNSKELAAIATADAESEDDKEDKVIAAAKQAAISTSKLVSIVNSSIYETSNQNEVFQQEFLVSSAKSVRSAILELIQATKDAISNPLDFLTEQVLRNCLKEVVMAIKNVVTASESLRKLREQTNKPETATDEGRERAEPDNTVVEAAKQAAISIKRLVEATFKGNQEMYVAAAKNSAEKLNQLASLAQKADLSDCEQALREANYSMITLSREVFRNPTVELYQQQLENAKNAVAEEIKKVIVGLQNKNISKKSEDTPAEAASKPVHSSKTHVGNLATQSAPSTVKEIPERRDSQALADPDKRKSLPVDQSKLATISGGTSDKKAKGPPVRPKKPETISKASALAVASGASLPPTNSHGSTSSSSSQKSLEVPKSKVPNLSVSALSTASTSATPASEDTQAEWIFRSGTPRASVVPAKAKPLQSKHRSSSQHSQPGELADSTKSTDSSSSSETPNDKAAKIIDYLRQFFPNFQKEWNAKDPTVQTSCIQYLAKIIGDTNLQPPQGVVSTPQEFDEDKLAAMELDDIIAMETFSEWRKTTTVGKNFNPTDLIHDVSSRNNLFSLEVGDDEDILKQLSQINSSFAKAVVDFIIKANVHSVLLDTSSVKTDNQLHESTKYVHNILKKISSLCLHTSLKSPPHLQKILSTALKYVSDAPTIPAIDENMIAASRSQSTKLLESNLKSKIYFESNTVRVLAIHLTCTINSLGTSLDSFFHHHLLQITGSIRCMVEATSNLLKTVETARAIAQYSRSKTTTDGSEEVIKLVDTKDINIWDETRQARYEDTEPEKEKEKEKESRFGRKKEKDPKVEPQKQLKTTPSGGTLNNLVEVLTSEKKIDSSYLKTFITTYQSFTTPWTLWAKLCQRYDTPAEMDSRTALQIKLRVGVVLKYWIENQFFDFDQDLIQKISTFVQTRLPTDDHKALAQQLQTVLTKKIEEREQRIKTVLGAPPTDLSLPPSLRQSPADFFLELNEGELARQLTLIDFDVFASIEPSELLNQSWNKEKLQHRAQHVLTMITRLNRLSFWVPSMVLWQKKKEDRARMIAKFIRLAEEFCNMSNFNTLMGIVAGLNMAAIQRLKYTLAAVPPEVIQGFTKLEQLMKPALSFKAYREALHKAKTPALPYLGVYLKDLTFMEDGNPDNIDNMINFQKREFVYSVIAEIQLFQQTPYKFPIMEPIHTFLSELPFSSDKDLYELSLFREPRDATAAQVV